ncbi:hypothetical protein EG329_002967 [Mollisiaceae sp. DMI_Dod_QoI]|nr:hypothetical protein EG329_002967 [Helotiales sp. DMI_Dod_QoI]
MVLSTVNREICVAPIEGQEGPYGYTPSLAAGIVFCALFGFAMLLHTFTSVRYRVWWQLVFTVGALTEVIGWAGRTWSSQCPFMTTPFLIQITTLIIAPAFFTAGIYVILGRLIRTFGPQVSPISANMYLYIFCSADIISLVIQAVGGASASVAYQKTPPGNTDNGTHIMVAGILFQLAAIIVFMVLFTVVIMRALRSNDSALRQKKVQAIIAATAFSVVCVVIRSIYRTIELLQGWQGYLITTQRFFLVLDGGMMVLALIVFNIVQPKWSEAWKTRGDSSVSELDGITIRGTSRVKA